MDADLQALETFRGTAARMPELLRWAMAGALAVGTLLGGIAGLVAGWVARGTR
jgi:hypothetical protein